MIAPVSPSPPKKILASDTLLVDHMINMRDFPELREEIKGLLQRSMDRAKTEASAHNGNGEQVGTNGQPEKVDKIYLNKAENDEFQQIIAGEVKNGNIVKKPGGSSANMLATLSRLLGDRVDVTFLGVAGDNENGRLVRKGLQEAGVKFVSLNLPKDAAPTIGDSYVMVQDDGSRITATYPGDNVKQYFTPENIPEGLLEKQDILMVQGSNWSKFGNAFPDHLLTNRWNHNKELWLAMPTDKGFASHPHTQETFQWLNASVNLILANGEELARIYKTDGDEEKALEQLQKQLKSLADKEHPLKGREQRRPQTAFVTLGKEGAALVTAHAIRRITPHHIEDGDRVNAVGAGDTSFGTFAAGHVAGMSAKAAAEMAMVAAAEKLKVNAAQLPDPLETLQKAAPEISDTFKKRIPEETASIEAEVPIHLTHGATSNKEQGINKRQ